MGFFDMLVAPGYSAGPPAHDDAWYQMAATASAAGVQVDPDTALNVGAVFRCVELLSNTVATPSLITYERLGEDGKQRARNHPLYSLLHDQPNSDQTSYQWRRYSQGGVLLRGNAYSRIVPGPRGFADQLVALRPERVTPARLPGRNDLPGPRVYSVRRDDGTSYTLHADEVLHISGPSKDGLSGMSVVGLARESIGLALATESYGARFFSQNSTPRGVLKVAGKLGKEGRERLAQSWREARAGLANAHGTAVLEDGLEWQTIGMSNEDSQFLESRSFQITEIARWFGVPPHMIGDVERSTSWGTGIEQMSLGFVIYSMLPHFVNWEQSLNSSLIIAKGRYFITFLLSSLLRGDQKSRYDSYAIGRQWGWLSVNDIRRFEDMNPVEGGETYLQPMNMEPLGTPPPEQPAPALPERGDRTARAELIAREYAGRLVRKEVAAVGKAAQRCASDAAAWREWVTEFYDGHTRDLARDLHIPEGQARLYCETHRDELIAGGAAAMGTWTETAPPVLADLALGEA